MIKLQKAFKKGIDSTVYCSDKIKTKGEKYEKAKE